jgi:hypothetical protein
MDLTLVEINVDGAQFGPAGPEGEETANRGVESDRPDRLARRTLLLDPAAVAFAAAVGYAASRWFRDDRGPAVDGEPVAIEG